MIEVTLHQRLSPVDMRLLPSQVLSHLLIGVAITMRLMVCLVHHIDTPTVTKLIEVFTIRIVRGTQEIDVRLFHQTDILFIGGIIYITPCLGMMVMAVHTTQLHVLTVNLEHFTDDLHLLHAEVIVKMFDDSTLDIA